MTGLVENFLTVYFRLHFFPLNYFCIELQLFLATCTFLLIQISVHCKKCVEKARLLVKLTQNLN